MSLVLCRLRSLCPQHHARSERVAIKEPAIDNRKSAIPCLSPLVSWRSQQVDWQRWFMKNRIGLDGLYSVANRRGATYPCPCDVTRQGCSVTRFCGAFLSSLRGEFLAPDRTFGVGHRPAAAFRAIEMASVRGLERLAAPRVRTSLHKSSLANRNGTVGTRGTGGTVYFILVDQRDGASKLGLHPSGFSPACNSATLSAGGPSGRGTGNRVTSRPL